MIRALGSSWSFSFAVSTLGAVSSAAYYFTTYRAVSGVYEAVASETESLTYLAGEEL